LGDHSLEREFSRSEKRGVVCSIFLRGERGGEKKERKEEIQGKGDIPIPKKKKRGGKPLPGLKSLTPRKAGKGTGPRVFRFRRKREKRRIAANLLFHPKRERGIAQRAPTTSPKWEGKK